MSIASKLTSRATSPLAQLETNLADLIHAIKNDLAEQIDASHEALRSEIAVLSRTVATQEARIGEMAEEIAALRGALPVADRPSE